MAKKNRSLVDKLIHPGHGEPTDPAEHELEADASADEYAKHPQDDPAPQPKESLVEAGASAESKHHHKKFDKFKKGN